MDDHDVVPLAAQGESWQRATSRSQLADDQICESPLIRQRGHSTRRTGAPSDVEDQTRTALAHVEVLSGEKRLVAYTAHQLIFGLGGLRLPELREQCCAIAAEIRDGDCYTGGVAWIENVVAVVKGDRARGEAPADAGFHR